jgi:pimeloyl-ACP methyl ester carboxylesterase
MVSVAANDTENDAWPVTSCGHASGAGVRVKPSDVRYATSSGGCVAYQVAGEGPIDLVFIPEWWNETESAWDQPLLADVLERLASFSRLICFDRRGCGISDPIPLGATPVLDDWLDDLRSVMDAVGSERAVLVGCSGGGPLSVLFAATHPDRVSSLILVNSYARFSRAPDFEIGVPQEIVERGLERIYAEWGTGALLDVLAPSLFGDVQFRRWWARYQRHSLSPGTAAAIQRMLFEIDVRDILPAVQSPTLVLQRVDDPFVRLSQARYLAEHIANARCVELPGNDHVFFAGDADALVDEIEAFATGTRRETTASRVLTTMLFTDIVGSTDRAAEIGDRAWRTLLGRHHAEVRAAIERFRGREIDTAGDGFFATFDGPARAVRCALHIGECVRELGLGLRAGVHTGEVEIHGDGLTGIAVHVAARVGARANEGEVLVTGTVRDLVAGSGLQFEDRGRHALKGVPDDWQIYAVSSPARDRDT